MTPERRIRRIRRWCKNGRAVPFASSLHQPPECCTAVAFGRWTSRVEKCDRLFAAELERHCRFTLQLMRNAEKTVLCIDGTIAGLDAALRSVTP